MRNIRRLIFPGIAILLFIIALGLSALAVDLVRAQEPQPASPDRPEAADARSNYFPIQGYLTDENGFPLNGSHIMVIRLYDVSTGGTPLCEDTRTTPVEDGLFNTYMEAQDCPLDGRMLYMGIAVEGDGEMSPRQYVDPVPLAWSLRPGAKIEYGLDSQAVLKIANLSTGPALLAESTGGAAIRAGGTGVIQSTAPTYLWVSGNGARAYRQADSTIIDMDTVGGAKIYRGATVGSKNIMLPITLPGTLYGQNTEVTGLDIYWSAQTEFDGITAVLMRRQTGVCAGSSCYVNLLYDTTDRSCEASVEPTGCVQHYDLDANNSLSSDSGVLYLTIEFNFSGASTWIDLGGVRLTLEYDG